MADRPDTQAASDDQFGRPPVSGGLRIALSCLMLAVVAIWGWAFILMKPAIEEFGVVSFLAIRFAIAAVVLAPCAMRRATGRSLRTGGLIGVVLAVSYIFQTFGLDNTTAINTGLITGLFIVFAPLVNRALFGVRTSWALWGAIVVSVLGLGLLTGWVAAVLRPLGIELPNGHGEKVGMCLGDWLTLGAAFCFGFHVVLLDRYARRHDASALAFGQIAVAAVVFCAVWPVANGFTWPSASVWFALVVTGALATAAAFLVQTFVQKRLTAVQTAAVIVTEPIFGAAFAWWLAGETLNPIQIIGAVLMVGSLAVVEIYGAYRR